MHRAFALFYIALIPMAFAESDELMTSIQQKDCIKAHSIADDILISNSKDIQALYAKGYCFHNEKQLSQAEDYFKKVHSQDPDYRRVNYNLSNIYLNQGKHDLAILHAARSIELIPSDSDSYALLAMAHGYNGNKPESMKYFAKSLALNPRNLKALFEKATLHLRNGEKNESCKLFNRIVEIEPRLSKLEASDFGCASD